MTLCVYINQKYHGETEEYDAAKLVIGNRFIVNGVAHRIERVMRMEDRLHVDLQSPNERSAA